MRILFQKIRKYAHKMFFPSEILHKEAITYQQLLLDEVARIVRASTFDAR